MKPAFLSLLAGVCAAFSTAHAQQFGNLSNVYLLPKHTVTEGSPYLPAEFQRGRLWVRDSKPKDVWLRLDAHQNTIEYLAPSGQPMQLASAAIGFALLDSAGAEAQLFRRGYPAVGTLSTPDTFFEVLYSGKITLLRLQKPARIELTNYNSATHSFRYDWQDSYFLARPDGPLVKLRRDRKALLKALADHEAELTAFLEKEKLKVVSWEEVRSVVNYYDTLLP